MASATPKLDFGLCKCCLKEANLKNMWYTAKNRLTRGEVYGQMLVDCFGIDWMIQGSIDDDKICEQCILKLQVAVNFKKQVLQSQTGILDSNKAVQVDRPKSGEELKNKRKAKRNQDRVSESEAEENSSLRGGSFSDNSKGFEEEFLEKQVSVGRRNDDDDNQNSEPAVKKPKLPRQRFRYIGNDFNAFEESSSPVKAKKTNTVKNAETLDVTKKKVDRKPSDTDEGQAQNQNGEDDVETILHKHRDNIRAILIASNATPLRGHWGKGYACSFCSLQFEQPSALKQHTYTHGGLLPIIKVKAISDHMIKLDVTNLQCNICDLQISDLEELMLHLKEIHNMLIHLDIQNHIVPFSFDNDYLKCVKCIEVFETFKDLSDHMSDTHYRNYACGICDRGFVNVRSLKTHCISHGINLIACGYCLQVFETKAELAEHEPVHLKSVDKVIYVEADTTKKHKQSIGEAIIVEKVAREIVNGVNQRIVYPCKKCTEVFEGKSDLLYHINSRHKPIKCSYCDETFDYQDTLRRHVTRVHPTKLHGCTLCFKKFYTEQLLSDHMVEHEKSFSCEVCCSQFSEEDVYLEHMKSKHGLE